MVDIQRYLQKIVSNVSAGEKNLALTNFFLSVLLTRRRMASGRGWSLLMPTCLGLERKPRRLPLARGARRASTPSGSGRLLGRVAGDRVNSVRPLNQKHRLALDQAL